MGTYDTLGGSAISPDDVDETCSDCGRDPEDCCCANAGLERYNVKYDCSMQPSPIGDYVLFKDALTALAARDARISELTALLNTPELHDFAKAIVLEAAHQRERWGTDHDGGKTPADWFWLIGYLAGKALHAHAAGNTDKALHHVITTAAAAANWHAAMLGQTNMRPGIEPPAALASPDSALQEPQK